VLDVETGKVHTLEFPDAISDVSVSAAGRPVVGCWVADARAEKIGAGVWKLPGGRV
jgi:hypothetical protein